MQLASSTLQLGDIAPNFRLPDLDGRPFDLADVVQGGSALLVFAPGVWSQTTRRQISELEEMHAELEALAILPLMVVTQRLHDARRSLQSFLASPERSLSEPALAFPILSDADRTVARAYGVFRAFSWDGVRVTRPSLFLVNPLNELTFIYVGRNDGDVPPMANVLYLLKSIAQSRLVSLGPETGLYARAVRGWDMSALPRVSKDGVPQIEQPVPVFALPAARPLDYSAQGSDGLSLADAVENELAKAIQLGPSTTEDGSTRSERATAPADSAG